MYRIMYLGQKTIGERCLRLLASQRYQNICIGAIVSNRYSQNVWWKSNSPYLFAKDNKIDFIDNTVRHSKEIKDCIIKNDINFIISVGHNWIIDRETIDMVGGNAVNLHLAVLPSYQGNFSYNHALLNHEKEYGVTLHFMSEEVDVGDYIFIQKFIIEQKDTAYSLYQKSLSLGETIFEKFIHILELGKEIPRYKMKGESHFYDRHSIDDKREIKNLKDMEDAVTKAKAFYFPPFENAYFIDKGIKFYIQPEMEK